MMHFLPNQSHYNTIEIMVNFSVSCYQISKFEDKLDLLVTITLESVGCRKFGRILLRHFRFQYYEGHFAEYFGGVTKFGVLQISAPQRSFCKKKIVVLQNLEHFRYQFYGNF